MTVTTDFKKYVEPYLDNFILVKFDEKELRRAHSWAKCKALTKLKSGEQAHRVDGDKEEKRNFTGQLGEMAVEKYFGLNFVDWSVGPSNHYNVPDIGPKNTGVKTVEYGKMPIVCKNSYYPEIICIKNPDDSIYICGLATPETLKKYQSDDMILDPKLKARGVKTGFYGFNHLEAIAASSEAA